ncbi:TPA: hypothetical protein ACGU4W_001103 [Vibrio vulnificus]|nr:hypothetical protein [Vibrio vulnificus]
MIELIKLDSKTRYNLLQNVLETPKPFYSKANYLNSCVKQLVTLYGKGYEKEIRCIATLTSRCQRYDVDGFRLHLTDEWYNNNNLLTKQDISRSRMSKLIHSMDADGYIEFCKGFPKWDNQQEQGQVSAIIIKGKLDSLIDRKVSVQQAPDLNELMGNIEFINLDETETIKTLVNGKLTKEKTYAYLTPNNSKPFFGLKQKRENLLKYNKLLQNFLIHDGDRVLKSVIFKRRFENDLTGAGRYWCDAVQGLSKSAPNANREGYRSLLTISGERVSEADFKTIQPRILYLEEGVYINNSFDVYGAKLEIDGMEQDEIRSIIKGCMMSILFSSSRGGAKTSITNKLKELGLAGKVTSELIIKAVEEHNAPIAHRFYNKDYYRVLQNYEARIAEYVIDIMTQQGKPVLCVHDSFVVRQQDSELLRHLMYEGWYVVTGERRNCVVQQEYGYTEDAGIEHTLEQPPIENYEDVFRISNQGQAEIANTFLYSCGANLLPEPTQHKAIVVGVEQQHSDADRIAEALGYYDFLEDVYGCEIYNDDEWRTNF